MNPWTTQSGRVPWFALAALVVLGLGVGVALRQSRPPRPAGPAPLGGEPAEETIHQALEQTTPAGEARAPVDSAAIKQRWLDEVPGINISGLDSTRLALFVRFANAERCTCGCGYTLAGCRASDMTCDVSGPRLDALLDSVRTGRIRSARGLRARPRSAVDTESRGG